MVKKLICGTMCGLLLATSWYTPMAADHPSAVTQAETAPTSGTVGENLEWEYQSTKKQLTIRVTPGKAGNGAIPDYTDHYDSSPTPWNAWTNKITSAVVEEGVTVLGKHTFANCNLKSVSLPESLQKINAYAFYDCGRLTKISIPSRVTELDVMAFSLCSALQNIDVSAQNSVYCSILGDLYNKEQTTLLRCAPGKTDASYTAVPSLTAIGDRAFSSCYNLTRITLHDNIESIGESAFSGCSNLTEITLPAQLKTLGDSAFWFCSALTEVRLPDSLTQMGTGEFFYCKSLRKVTLPAQLTDLPDTTFVSCEALTEVTLPEELTRIGWNAFYGCTSLEQLTLPDSVLYLGEAAFEKCSSLRRIHLPKSLAYLGSGAFSNCTALEEIQLPEGLNRIPAHAFSGCSSLKGIQIPASVREIEAGAFMACTGISAFSVAKGNRSFSAPDGNLYNRKGTTLIQYAPAKTASSFRVPEKVTCVDQAFYSCANLKHVTLPKGISEIGSSTFANSGLTEITVPEGVTKIGYSAFLNCTQLTSVRLPSTLTEMEVYAFDNTALENSESNWEQNALYLDGWLVQTKAGTETQLTVKDGTVGMAEKALAENETLQSVTLPASLKHLYENPFSACEALTQITVKPGSSAFSSSNGVLYSQDRTALLAYPRSKDDSSFVIPESVTVIRKNAFSDNSLLAQITFPAGLKDIQPNAFYSCSALQQVTLPDGFTQIGNSAFQDCTALEEAYIPGSVSVIGESAFQNCTLTRLTLSEGIRTILRCAFMHNPSLAQISLPGSLTAVGDYVIDDTAYQKNPDNWKNGMLMLDHWLLDSQPNQTAAERLSLEEGTVGLADYAMAGDYPSLKELSFPESMAYIGSYALPDGDLLQSITVDPNNEHFTALDGVLYNKDMTRLVRYPSGKTDSSFSLPDGVQTIAEDSFNDNTRLTDLVLPLSLQKIEDYACTNCSGLKTVHYEGSRSNWNAVSVGPHNKYLSAARPFYAAESSTNSHVSKEESGCTVQVQGVFLSPPAYVAVAGYRDGAMIDSQILPYEDSMPPVSLTGDFSTVKVMVWETLEDLEPFTPVEIIPQEKWRR